MNQTAERKLHDPPSDSLDAGRGVACLAREDNFGT